MRISDWSSDVCSSDLCPPRQPWRAVTTIMIAAIIIVAIIIAVIAIIAATAIIAGIVTIAAVTTGVLTGAITGAIVATAEIGRAHVLTPVTNAHLVCRRLLEKKNNIQTYHSQKDNHIAN